MRELTWPFLEDEPWLRSEVSCPSAISVADSCSAEETDIYNVSSGVVRSTESTLQMRAIATRDIQAGEEIVISCAAPDASEFSFLGTNPSIRYTCGTPLGPPCVDLGAAVGIPVRLLLVHGVVR